VIVGGAGVWWLMVTLQQNQAAMDEKAIPKPESAIGKWKPPVDMRCLLRKMSAELTTIQTMPMASPSSMVPGQ
jgi:hypothetical protein